MAISFDLDWGVPVTGDRLATEFVAIARSGGLLAPEASVGDLRGDGVVLRGGMWCRAGAAEPRTVPWPAPLEGDFGVVSACWSVFREDGDFDREVQRDEMVWLVAGLLARLPGDVGLHYQYEVLWLLRREGTLVVSDRDDIWTPERLAMLAQPYERAHLVFSDEPDG